VRIKEFSIIRYGPLPNTGRIILQGFNLFFGKNEDGKTLTIDGLVKLLLGEQKVKDFERIDRVEENPEGYVLIEDDKGEEIKLPEKGDLIKVAGLSPAECRNIFIIRNSELSIFRENEFYTSLTDRLTGLRTTEISRIKNVLIEIGKITPKGKFSGKAEYGNLEKRIENAINIIQKIETLSKEIEKKGFDGLEEKSVKCKEEKENIEREIENLEDARKREKYEKGKEALDILQPALEKIKDLEVYNEDDEQLWRDCEKEIKKYVEEREILFTELGENEKEYKEINEELSQKERDFQVLDERRRKLDDEIKPELKNYEIKSGELASQRGKSNLFTQMGIISAILLGISLLGVIIRQWILFYILTGLFSILSLISWIFKFKFVRDKDWLAGMFERIKLSLSKFELDSESIEGISLNIQKFDEEYRKKNNELQEIKRKKENFEAKIKELEDKAIPDIKNKIKDAEKKIVEIKRKSKEESLEEYTAKLKSKGKLERSKLEQESVLKSFFERKSKELEENIAGWNEEITSLEEYKDKSRDIKYNENTVSSLKEKKQEVEKELNKLKEKMVSFQKNLEEIERSANEVLRLEEEHLYCKTSVDLEAIKDKLQKFVKENETVKNNVWETMKIFEEIKMEEKGKISELFGKDSPVSKYFSEITRHLYEEIMFNRETGEIEVRRKDGKILKAEKLSGGAYDQLYLSIRLAFGEKILKGKKGFFIMDDPFVKADPERLKKQIDVLKKISGFGWQVIYFSAKGEVKDILKQDIEKKNINYVEV